MPPLERESELDDALWLSRCEPDDALWLSRCELDDELWLSRCEPDDALRLELELDCPSPCDELLRSRFELLDDPLMPLFSSRELEPLFELFC